MPKTQITTFRGYPVIVLGAGTEQEVRLGYRKAKAVLDHIEDVKQVIAQVEAERASKPRTQQPKTQPSTLPGEDLASEIVKLQAQIAAPSGAGNGKRFRP